MLPCIDYDEVCQPFLKSIEKRYGFAGSYEGFCQSWRIESYAALMNVVISNLQRGVSLIVSAPFTREKLDPDYFHTIKRIHEIEFSCCNINLIPTEETLLKNLRTRNSDRDSEKLADWEHYYAAKNKEKVVWDADYIFHPTFGIEESLMKQVEIYLTKIEFV